MSELAIVVAIVTLLAGVSVSAMFPWETLMDVGWMLVGFGMVTGVPTGVMYHVQLHRALRRRGLQSWRVLTNPIALHARLVDAELRTVTPWFVAGGAGFAVVVIGILFVALALARAAAG